MSDHTIKDQVNKLNEQAAEELGRWIRLHVSRVGEEIPADLVTKRRRRAEAPRAVEVSLQDAQTLIDILQAGLDRKLPGTISFVLYGYEEL